MFVSGRISSKYFYNPKVIKWGTFWVMTNALTAIHELGHYFACKKYNRKVVRFQVGVPELVSCEASNRETFVWGALPVVGYVDSEKPSVYKDGQKILAKRKKEDLEICFMGPCFGYVASWAMFALSKKLPVNAIAEGMRLAGMVGLEANILNAVPNPYLPTDGGKIYQLLRSTNS